MSKKVVFMGTPEFAVASLSELVNQGIHVCAVVTMPDKPAGRGQQIVESAVKIYAKEKGLPILQPTNLKDEEFLSDLKKLNADLFVVVAFRMLPEVVWEMPQLGTINLHGSLLPQYRGAAPINWAVINGDAETGATTFFIEKEIDTGKIIDSVKIKINENDDAGIVHDRLMVDGAKLLSKTVLSIFNGTAFGLDQLSIPMAIGTTSLELKSAPKIFKPDCKIDWRNSTNTNYNKIRGLAPYPTAWTEIEKDDIKKSIKLFKTKKEIDSMNHHLQIQLKDGSLFFGCNDGWLEIIELQIEGKKRMPANEFLKGFNLADWKLIN